MLLVAKVWSNCALWDLLLLKQVNHHQVWVQSDGKSLEVILGYCGVFAVPETLNKLFGCSWKFAAYTREESETCPWSKWCNTLMDSCTAWTIVVLQCWSVWILQLSSSIDRDHPRDQSAHNSHGWEAMAQEVWPAKQSHADPCTRSQLDHWLILGDHHVPFRKDPQCKSLPSCNGSGDNYTWWDGQWWWDVTGWSRISCGPPAQATYTPVLQSWAENDGLDWWSIYFPFTKAYGTLHSGYGLRLWFFIRWLAWDARTPASQKLEALAHSLEILRIVFESLRTPAKVRGPHWSKEILRRQTCFWELEPVSPRSFWSQSVFARSLQQWSVPCQLWRRRQLGPGISREICLPVYLHALSAKAEIYFLWRPFQLQLFIHKRKLHLNMEMLWLMKMNTFK